MNLTSPLRAAMLASAAFAMSAFALTAAAHADTYLRIAKAPGEVATRGFEDHIAVISASFNIMNMLTYGEDGLAEPTRVPYVSAITINKTPDRASPKLMLAAIQDQDLGTIELTFTTPTRGGQLTDARWILDGAKIASFAIYPGANAGDPAVEMIEVSYTSMRYQHYLKDAKGARTGAMEEVRWDAPATDPQMLEGGH